MSEKMERVDWSETDLLMEQLRQKLAEDESALVKVPQDEDAPQEFSPIIAEEAGKTEAEQAPAAEAEALEAPAVMLEKSVEAAEPAPLTEDTEEKAPVKKSAPAQRRKRKRIPKLSELEKQAEITPLGSTQREALLQRKRELAAQDDGDIYWQTEGGKTTVPVPPKKEKGKTAQRPARATAKARVTFDTMPNLAGEAPVKREESPAPENGVQSAASLVDERFADLTVEGLIQDIFGSVLGEAAPKAEKKPVVREKQSATVETVSNDDLLPKSFEENTPVVAPVEVESDVKLEFGGERLVLPVDLAEGSSVAHYGTEVTETEKTQEAEKEEAEAAITAVTEPESPKNENLFAGVSVKRMPKDGVLPKPSIAKMSADQLALKRQLDESDEDFRLLLDLDYEEELGRAIGFEKIREYQEKHINGNLKEQKAKRATRKKRFEYGSHAQDINITKIYTKRRHRAIVNLAVSTLAMILLFVLESKAFLRVAFGVLAPEAPYPALYLLLSIFLLLVPAFLLRKRLFAGLAALFRLSAADYSFSSVAVLVTLLYHILLFFLPVSAGLSVFLSPAAASLVLLSLAGLLNCYREQAAFRVVSTKQPKYALLSRISVGGARGNAALRLQQPESESPMLYARPVDFVRKYFTNTEKKESHRSAMGSLLLLITAFAVLVGFAAPVFGAAPLRALYMAVVVFLTLLPALSALLTAVPMFFAAQLLLGERAAVVGEETVYTAAKGAELVLSADACFVPMRHEQFELVKGCDPVRSRALIRALLERIESPLRHSVEVLPEARVLPASVCLTDVSADGVAAVVTEDKKTTMLFGSVKYLQKYGIRVSPKSEERYGELCRHMLCVAVNNKLTALFITKYRLQPELPALLEALTREGLTLTVRTMDPGIHAALMKRLCADLPAVIGVQKPLAAEMDLRTERVDATVVALGSAREAVRAYAVCHRIRRALSIGRVFQILSVIFGVGISLALFSIGRLHALAPASVALLSILFGGIFSGVSYLFLKDNEK